jgi:hypothetical protein
MREIVEGDSSSFSAACSMVRPASTRSLRSDLTRHRCATVGLKTAHTLPRSSGEAYPTLRVLHLAICELQRDDF